MDKRIVQVNIRTSAETAERLKAIADQGGVTLGALIEKMLASYQPDSSVLASSEDWRDALATLANEFQTAVMALESRLVALEAANIGKVAPRRKAAKIGLESAVEPSSILPKESKNKAGQDGERELSPESLFPVDRVEEVDVTQPDEQLSAKDKMIVGLFDSGITNLSEIGRRLKKNGFMTKRNEPIHAANVKRVLIAQKRLPAESKRSR